MKSVLITTLIALGVSVSSAFAADKPLEDKPAEASSTEVSVPSDKAATSDATANIEIREAAKFFDESFNDMQDEIKTAKADGKQGLLIMFEMDECPFCHRMKTTVLNRSDIQDYYKENFRIISVDIEGDLELTNFQGETTTQKDFSLKEFRVRATPVFQFVGLDGEPVKNGRLTGATKDAEEFMLFGKYVVDKQNENMPFSKFKREQTNDAKS